MKITVIGAGYVGAVTAACLAELGHHVICTDTHEPTMADFQQGKAPFFEPGLEALITKHTATQQLTYTTDTEQAIDHGDIIYLCVLTLPLPNGKPDFKALQAALKTLAQHIKGPKLLVEKTTLPLKTGDWLRQNLRTQLPSDVAFDVAVVPQFMREGSAIHDFLNPDRIVIGAESAHAVDTLKTIYAPINAPLLITDTNSAELIKHASNAFLAMKISFINTISQLCEKTGADIRDVSQGIGLDARIGNDFLQAGIGYGGIFFSKDIHSLMNVADQYHVNLDLLKATEVINRYQRLHFVEQLEQAVNGLEGKRIAVWGLAYRPNTDDMRDTPSQHIIRSIQNRGATVVAFDPLAMEKAKKVLTNVTFAPDMYAAAHQADAIAVVTEWDEFKLLDLDQLKASTTCRIMVDGRNLFTPATMAHAGFYYVSLGSAPVDGRAKATAASLASKHTP
jgi:UDPglucose 6-dehydrogenase